MLMLLAVVCGVQESVYNLLTLNSLGACMHLQRNVKHRRHPFWNIHTILLTF